MFLAAVIYALAHVGGISTTPVIINCLATGVVVNEQLMYYKGVHDERKERNK